MRLFNDMSLRAKVDVLFSNGIKVSGVQLRWHEKKQCFYIQFPSYKRETSFEEIVALMNDELEESLLVAIIEMYDKRLEKE